MVTDRPYALREGGHRSVGTRWVHSSLGVQPVEAPRRSLAYVRERVTVDGIQGGQAVLTDGPHEGNSVVTEGAAELYGTEFGVGH
jgi:hypothetical protein